ncbi:MULTISPECIES: hypothetical protein [unclassified Leptolyngbya]|uniref:hypothetical protein n=1 Tax=unclassified Leptolyngbya TaxID=2650499 RepID=UPI0016891C4B|nr:MULTISPECIES: hypothetical protein [unclassified Leptolyngbya]MBD1912135.1 hypothetical protein [Leptolyngbya sp. FACHB-8]MBD2155026.1 hypothetical protein [Leptolyngbya sp. FACHB-16]
MHSSLQAGIPEMNGHLEAQNPEIPYWVVGEVVVDPSAAIAPGTLLLAEPGCRLFIGPGVCMGTGSIVHGFGGDLTIEAGAVVGSAALLLGNGKIGAKACIGASATLVNPTVEAGQMILQDSYNGSLGLEGVFEPPSPEDLVAAIPDAPRTCEVSPHEQGPDSDSEAKSVAEPSQNSSVGGTSMPPIASQVYGLEAFYRLMTMIFPSRDFPTGSPALSNTPPASPTHDLPEGGES